MLTMLTTLMDITEAESGVMPLRREHVSIEALLTGVVDLYQLIAEDRRIKITVDVDAGLSAFVDVIRGCVRCSRIFSTTR